MRRKSPSESQIRMESEGKRCEIRKRRKTANHSSSRLSPKRRRPWRWRRWEEEEGQGQEGFGGVETERVKGWCCHM